MGQSVDYKQLEVVSQFSKLLTILGNPDQLKATLQAAQDVLAENKALLGPLAEKKALDELLDREEKLLGEKKLKMEDLLASAQVEANRILEQATKKSQEATVGLDESKKLKKEVSDLQKAVKEELDKQKQLTLELEKKGAELDVLKEQLALQTEALVAKQEKLKQVLGE